MTNGVLSFNFSDVKVSTGPSIGDIPVGVPLYATVDTVKLDTFNGTDKFVLTQTVYIDLDDGGKTVEFKTFIGPKHGWLLAQYLNAVGEDFRSLSGQGISADALQTVLAGHPLSVTFKESTYPDRTTGQQRTSKQITVVRPIDK